MERIENFIVRSTNVRLQNRYIAVPCIVFNQCEQEAFVTKPEHGGGIIMLNDNHNKLTYIDHHKSYLIIFLTGHYILFIHGLTH